MRMPKEEEYEEPEKIPKISKLKRNYDKLYWLWIAIIVLDLVIQSLRSAEMSTSRERLVGKIDL